MAASETSASISTGLSASTTLGARIEAWRVDYNHVRPHGSLGGLPPRVFALGAGLQPTASPSAPPFPPPTQERNQRSS